MCYTPPSESIKMPGIPNKKRYQTLILFARLLNQLLPYAAGIVSVYPIVSGKLRVSQAKCAVINPVDPLQNPSHAGVAPHSLLSSLYVAKRFPEKIFTRKTIAGAGIANA
jgi:hypothetical protein